MIYEYYETTDGDHILDISELIPSIRKGIWQLWQRVQAVVAKKAHPD